MQTARYGRMSLGRCVKRDLGYLGCAVDVLDLLDSRCSGHSSCSMKIIDDALYQKHPCPDDFTAYLEASYSCIKGMCNSILITPLCFSHILKDTNLGFSY